MDMWEHYDRIDAHDGDEIINGYQVYHTPGHSPGHICIGVGPILFVGDLIWASSQSYILPESLMPGLGLGTYMTSLRKIANLGIPLGLAGHGRLIHSAIDRAVETEAHHHQYLSELLDLCRKDTSLCQLADKYCKRHPEFIGASSFDRLKPQKKIVCLEDIRAHMEYLMDHNQMIVSDNLNGVSIYRSDAASIL